MPSLIARFAPFACLVLAAPLFAQAAPAPAPQAAVPSVPPIQVDRSPWLYKGSDLGQDKAWRFGTLPNGLRYAVRRNGVPPRQVAVRVRIDAGSLAERDSERGYAHLIEHLSFRGSKHVPDGEAKRIWQRLGATFGTDSNALTSPTQTVYKLDLPSATPAGLDESMKLLAGMMEEPGLDAAALNAERPVVLAEQREQPGPQLRRNEAVRKLFFAGQLLADRSPIGSIDTLTAATAESVQAFHDRWYRPENVVIVVSGDMEPDVLEATVIRHFAGWRGEGPPAPLPDFGKPESTAPRTASITEPSLPPMITYAILRPWTYRDDTVIFNQKRLVDLLGVRVINRRLEERARGGASYLLAVADLDDISRSVNATTVTIQPIGDDWKGALRDVRVAIADAMLNPPSEAEIARHVAEIDAMMKQAVDTSRVEAGAKQADDMVEALDIRETVTTPEVAYELLQDMKRKGMFTPASVTQSTQRIFTGDATRALIALQQPAPDAEAQLAQGLAADVSKLIGKRRAQAEVSFDRLPKLGAPGKIVSREFVTALPVEKVRFANGVNLLAWQTDGETGRVYVRVRFGRGAAALPRTADSAAWAADLALLEGGIGKLTQNDVEAMTAGRRIGMDFAIADDAFELAAMTNAADLPDQLRLFAAKLAKPGWDPNPVARARAARLSSLVTLDSSPDGVLNRDLERLLRDGDPRWGTPSRETITAITPARFRKLWEPLLASGPIEVLVFGDMKQEEAVTAVAATFGALQPRRDAPVAPGAAVGRFPAHRDTPQVLYHKGPETQAAAVIAWPTGGGSAGISEGRRLEALAALFSDRLLDRLRSQEGASYSPQMIADWPVGLDGGGTLVAIGMVEPAKTELFFRLSREIAADLAARPVSDDELRRIMAPLTSRVTRMATGNQFWLRQMLGGTRDQARIDAVGTIGVDYGGVTPADLQALAVKYLRPDKDWTLAVMPTPAKEGQ